MLKFDKDRPISGKNYQPTGAIIFLVSMGCATMSDIHKGKKAIMEWHIDWLLFCCLVIAFIFFTIIGTLSHELGHWSAARLMGFDASINYGASWLIRPHRTMSQPESFLFTLGGPVQTLLTGTIGLLLLGRYRRSFYAKERLSIPQWFLVFISLFWLRPTANFCTWIIYCIMAGKYASGRSDEIKLSRYLGLPEQSLSVITGLTGLFVLVLVVFRFIPVAQRLTFILSGLVGGVSGFLFWLVFFGKIIFP